MNIAIIGHFGGDAKFYDGQTIKTIELYDALISANQNVDKVDTYYIKRKPFRFIWEFIHSLIKDKKYILLVSNNGRRVLFPILMVLSKYFNKDIYHYAIGGRLALEVESNLNYKKYISSFKRNWMESRELVYELKKQGIGNATYLPNFKKLRILDANSLKTDYKEPYRLCTFSRVMKEKGIEDAIKAVNVINDIYGRKIVSLDIYGAVEKKYLDYLSAMLNDSCKYCGVVNSEESTEVLKKYYALLFPSYWDGEGMPGTIIDALSAGLPVIARRWKYCDEMLEDGVTAYIYDFDKPQLLKDRIIYSIEHINNTISMKRNCLNKAKEYSADIVIKEIINELEKE